MSSLPVDDDHTPAPGVAYQRCIQEIQRESPDYQLAQLYATLSLDETLRKMIGQLSRLTRSVTVASRRR